MSSCAWKHTIHIWQHKRTMEILMLQADLWAVSTNFTQECFTTISKKKQLRLQQKSLPMSCRNCSFSLCVREKWANRAFILECGLGLITGTNTKLSYVEYWGFGRLWHRPLRTVASQRHLGYLLLQSGDAAVLKDDTVSEWLELSQHLFQLIFHFLARKRTHYD